MQNNINNNVLGTQFSGKALQKILTQRNHTFSEGEHIVCDTNCEIERAFPPHLPVCSTYREKDQPIESLTLCPWSRR